MFIIQNKQIEAFKEKGLKNFEDEMTVHLEKYFPTQFSMIGEIDIRKTIQYGHKKAEVYRFVSKRNVCLFLNNMILLGSNFDSDPLYPWAQPILGNSEKNANIRIDEISDKTLEIIDQITGPHHLYLNKALLNFCNNADNIFQKIKSGRYNGYKDFLKNLFFQRYEVIGDGNLDSMCLLGIKKATSYNIRDEIGVYIYMLMMFTLGSSFDKDPQFPWAKRILTDPECDERDKVELLYQNLRDKIENFIIKK